jgi:hypothetical protein
VTAYLDAHPNRNLAQQRPRREKPSGVLIIHTAESALDVIGEDTGAEGVARYISERTTYGSYHRLADSDSVVAVARFEMTTYGDGTGSNDHAIHISFACRASDWARMSPDRRTAFIANGAKAAAEAARWLKKHHGITVPARRITRPESDHRVPGFISHAERDPDRRFDPGAHFPWQHFLAYYAAEMAGSQPDQSEEDDMPSAREIADAILDSPLNVFDPAGNKTTANVTVREHYSSEVIARLEGDKAAKSYLERAAKSAAPKG